METKKLRTINDIFKLCILSLNKERMKENTSEADPLNNIQYTLFTKHGLDGLVWYCIYIGR